MRVADELKRNSTMLAEYAEHGKATMPPPLEQTNKKKQKKDAEEASAIPTAAEENFQNEFLEGCSLNEN